MWPQNHKSLGLGPRALIFQRGKLRPGERWWLVWLRSSSLLEAGHICLLRSTRLRALSLTSRLVLKLLQRSDELACLHSRNFAKPLVSLLLWEETHILHWHLQKARHAGSLHKCTCHSAWPSCGPGVSASSHQRNGWAKLSPEKHCLLSSWQGLIVGLKKCLFFNIMQHLLWIWRRKKDVRKLKKVAIPRPRDNHC